MGRGRALLLVAAACACTDAAPAAAPPTGQLLLHVDTDAPVVPADGHSPDETEAIPLFDRVRFDLVPPGAADGTPCDGCSQDFAVDADAFTQGSVSVGLRIPPAEPGWSARVRLYVLRFSPLGGDPDPDASLDATFTLPAVGAEGVVDVTATLSTDSVGQPQTGAAIAMGAPGASQVGSWPSATRTPCSGVAPRDMVCVPGGAFWMGAPASDVPPGTLAGWHRLVVLSPFFLDATEMTVATARTIGPVPTEVAPWNGASSGNTAQDFCTYTASPGMRDALPLTCVSQFGAHDLCKHRGADLPTEAQLEYVMGALRMQPFVWGTDPPRCGDAIWGRNGAGILLAGVPQVCRAKSNTLGLLGGPEPPKHGAYDHLDLAGGSIWDLTGNVGEWAKDAYQPLTGGCWGSGGPLVDPSCSAGSAVVERGGAWTSGGAGLEAAGRIEVPGVAAYDLGLRCAAAAR